MDRKALLIAAGTGAVAQVVLVVLGHFVAAVADNLFAVGGLAICAAAGVIYARRTGEPYVMAGGAAAGAACAAVGIALSVLLGDVPPVILAIGVLAGAAAGLIGAAAERALRG